jgi:RNA polymerase sigma-70 factor (ECF subfamily)
LMRRILIDHARKVQYQKRGGGAHRVPLDEAVAVTEFRAAELLALDEALDKLTAMDARKGKIIELRFFGGLTEEETAQVIGVSLPTVQRDLRLAKAWLRRMLMDKTNNEV